MKAKSVPSSWLVRDGCRLDCNPYMSGALEAKVLLEGLRITKMPLQDVCLDGRKGLVNAGRIKRQWVTDERHGLRFLSSTDILKSDLSDLQLISKEAARANPKLQIRSEWTLITRAGTIGRMAYSRPDMAGLACSEDVLRVIPDAEKIPPGYLYAYLSSKFGVPLVVGGTYGAIIQHIEPEHIANLPVPRLGKSVEDSVHDLVDSAARRLSDYSRRCNEATAALLAEIGISDVTPARWLRDQRALGWVERSLSTETFRAMNYDPRARELWRTFERANGEPLGSLCKSEYFKGKNIFKRVDAAPEFGVMLLGQRNAFHFRPDGRWISRKSVERQGLGVPPLSTLIPSHGTLGEHELYCRALLVTPSMCDFVFSGDFFRCVPEETRVLPGYLFAFLRSNAAFRILRSISIGGKQQEQHPALMWRLPVPRLGPDLEETINSYIEQAVSSYDAAVHADRHARQLVEDTIEKAAN